MAARKLKKIKDTTARGKPRNKALSIQKLLEAGLNIFSKYGFESATTKQIAKSAGMNDAMIIRYFKTKAGLLQAVILQYAASSHEKFRGEPVKETLEEEIASFLRSSAEEYLAQRDFHRIAISRLLTDRKLIQKIDRVIGIDPKPALAERLLNLQKLGKVPADSNIARLTEIIHLESLGIMLKIILLNRTAREEMDLLIREAARILASGINM